MLNTCKMKFYFVKSGLSEQKSRFLNIMTCKIRRLGYEIPAALLTERFRPVRGSVFLVRHIPEQQRDAPHGGQAHDGIDDPADHAGRSAAGEGHQVELEQPHAAPVQTADDQQGQGDFINNHGFLPPPNWASQVVCPAGGKTCRKEGAGGKIEGTVRTCRTGKIVCLNAVKVNTVVQFKEEGAGKALCILPASFRSGG